jgi:hypothetical protein
MNLNGRRKGLSVILFLALVFIAGCDKSEREHGYLMGLINIGPLCPVEKNPADPGCLPTAETYKAYPVSVYSSDGEDRMEKLEPNLDGKYSCELPAGKYIVLIDKSGTRTGWSNLPEKISISPSDTTWLNINIDTGIR